MESKRSRNAGELHYLTNLTPFYCPIHHYCKQKTKNDLYGRFELLSHCLTKDISGSILEGLYYPNTDGNCRLWFPKSGSELTQLAKLRLWMFHVSSYSDTPRIGCFPLSIQHQKTDDLGGVPQKVQELRSSSSPLLTNKSSQLRGTDQRRWWQWSSSSRQGEVVTATCYRQYSVLLWDVRVIEFQWEICVFLFQ